MKLRFSLRGLLGGGSNSRVVTTICSQDEFSSLIAREHARAERSGIPFSVLELRVGQEEEDGEQIAKLLQFLSIRLRTTDEVGWIDDEHIGVLLFGTPLAGAKLVAESVVTELTPSWPSLQCNIHVFPMPPDDNTDTHDGQKSNAIPDNTTPERTLLSSKPDINPNEPERRPSVLQCDAPDGKPGEGEGKPVTPSPLICIKPLQQLRPLYANAMPWWKRALDISVSVAVLLLFSPLLLATALLIKYVSPGPVLYRQSRVGYGGKIFTVLKFRTMHANADESVHRALLEQMVESAQDDGNGMPMSKIENDPRVIPFGNFLRRSCIDEMPQFFNVLMGDMSLVGPRPPVAYELKRYATWHNGRFDAVPGITGLWQVSGKNRLTFKQMARLDIRYARQMSFWLDLKILTLTPLVILWQLVSSKDEQKGLSATMKSHPSSRVETR